MRCFIIARFGVTLVGSITISATMMDYSFLSLRIVSKHNLIELWFEIIHFILCVNMSLITVVIAFYFIYTKSGQCKIMPYSLKDMQH